jgi:hypothetical protein
MKRKDFIFLVLYLISSLFLVYAFSPFADRVIDGPTLLIIAAVIAIISAVFFLPHSYGGDGGNRTRVQERSISVSTTCSVSSSDSSRF